MRAEDLYLTIEHLAVNIRLAAASGFWFLVVRIVLSAFLELESAPSDRTGLFE